MAAFLAYYSSSSDDDADGTTGKSVDDNVEPVPAAGLVETTADAASRPLEQSLTTRTVAPVEADGPAPAVAQLPYQFDHGQVVALPPEPSGAADATVVAAVQAALESFGSSDAAFVASLRTKKAFRNPYILKGLVEFMGIDERGSQYPRDVFDPHSLPASAHYRSVAAELARLEQEARAT